MPIAVVTRLRVRSWRHFPAVAWAGLRSALLARAFPGNLGVSISRDSSRAWWTRSTWTDDSAMKSYVVAEIHRAAMAKVFLWCDESSVVHWRQESPALPSWDEAYARALRDGRHFARRRGSVPFTIPKPDFAPWWDWRFKQCSIANRGGPNTGVTVEPRETTNV